MSRVISEVYFQVPKHIVESGKLRLLAAAELKLYLYLLYLAQQKTKVSLRLTNRELSAATGLSANSLAKARKKLAELKLISLTQQEGAVVECSLLDSRTGAPIAAPNRYKTKPDANGPFRHSVSPMHADTDIGLQKQSSSRLTEPALVPVTSLPSTRPTLKQSGKCHTCDRAGRAPSFWMDKDGRYVCNNCHPNPSDQTLISPPWGDIGSTVSANPNTGRKKFSTPQGRKNLDRSLNY